jgi:serine/threonine protein kinase
MPTPETLRLGRYRIVSVLGRSHYADVYEALDTKSGDRVAVKVLTLSGTHRDIAEAMFRKEVGALAGFNHSAVVKMLDHFAEPQEDRLGIVLELIPGGLTLEKLITEVRAGMESRRTLRWKLEQLLLVLDGLESAHRRMVIHRDVKPANVLVDRDDYTLRLADFGVARLLENYGRGNPGVTLREFYTRPFAAPEQVLHGDAGTAADLHAFGLVAASLLSWELPSPTFKLDQLHAFLAPFRDEMPDSTVVLGMEECLAGLLSAEPSSRPRVHEISRCLRELLERTTERTTVSVSFGPTAVKKARECGCISQASILADLNDGLHVRYEPSKDLRTGGDSFKLKFYGRGLWAEFKPDDRNPEHLFAINVGRDQPNIHLRRKEGALPAPFTLSLGYGSAAQLIQLAYEHYQEERRLLDERRRKESLLEVARFILERQRERMLTLRIRYQCLDEKPGQAPGAQPSPESSLDSHIEPRGDFLQVRVREVLPAEPGVDPPEGLQDIWTDGLDKRSPFLVDEEPFATFHGYDPAKKVLSLRLQSHRKIRREGEFHCKDIAMEAALSRQESALDHLFENDCANPNLGHLLLHPEENRLGEILPRTLFQDLEPQREMQGLIERALAAEDFFFLQGPPGTGKTTAITEIVGQLLVQHPEARILLTSQANEAVNNALDALRELAQRRKAEWRLLRDVREERSESFSELGFDAGFKAWVTRTRVRCASALAQYESSIPPGQATGVTTAIMAWSDGLEHGEGVRKDYAESIQVFGVTCLRVPALWTMLREVRFDWVIVDEAAKATPAEVLVPLVMGRKFILVGDHRQLPPFLDTQTERDIAGANLDPARARRSLFEDLFDKVPQPNRETLRRQFRMHRSIGSFVGDLYYDDLGGLETGVPDSDRTLALAQFDRPHRVFWLDVKGRERPEGKSWWNQEEIDAIDRLLKRFSVELRARNTKYSVGVIAAYRSQALRLGRAIRTGRDPNLRVRIDTVDAFQGKQDDIVISSLVRVGDVERRFISDSRRLNVAFSRAQRLLVIVGHRASAMNTSGLAKAIQLIPPENFITDGGSS